jgi:hypothetical protein
LLERPRWTDDRRAGSPVDRTRHAAAARVVGVLNADDVTTWEITEPLRKVRVVRG